MRTREDRVSGLIVAGANDRTFPKVQISIDLRVAEWE